jgi:hypothetical protein
MPLRRELRFERTDIWREGKWIDLWSVVHFLSGVSLGLGTYFFKFGIQSSFIIVFLLLVAYEMWEAIVQIEETPQNRFMDVVVGMGSFSPTFLYLAPEFTHSHLILVFGLITTLNTVLATFGWRESRKAQELEQKVRAEIAERRAKFLENRARRRERKDK